MFFKSLVNGILAACFCTGMATLAQDAPKPHGPVPSEQQIKWLRMEWYAFVHFGLNTYTDREWGYGDEKPELFNPSNFDADAIVKTFKDAGMKGMIYTAKHHDGFCTWPTKSTTHNITQSPWKNGKGDVVREFANACKKHKFAFGTYLSPWDRNCAEYGKPGYLNVYYKQIEELLTNYGDIFEIWFDGAMGGDGYYGGARQNRDIGNADTYYNFAHVVEMIRRMQPNCIIWGASGRGDATWAGSEQGYARSYPLWNTRNNKWLSWEADTPINHRGWFWHPGQGSHVKSPEDLMKIYMSSVGRGANLILNLAPNREGQLDPADVASLQAFGKMRRQLLEKDYAQGATCHASSEYGSDQAAAKLTDADIESYWTPAESDKTPSVEITLNSPATFDVIRLREQIRLGQRVEAFQVEAWVNGAWKTIVAPGQPGQNENAPTRGKDWLKYVQNGKGYTIGNQVMRWLSEPVTTDKLRLTITRSKAVPCISEFSLLRMPKAQKSESAAAAVEQGVLNSAGWSFGGFAAGKAAYAFDGKPETMWEIGRCPSHFRVDMKKEYTVNGFAYLPRQDGKTHGMTSRYRFETSLDGNNWTIAAEGEFGNLRANPVEQIISITPQKARYIRFFSTAALDGKGSSVAELKIYGK